MIISLKELAEFCKYIKNLIHHTDILLLSGDLGAGKTTFTRHFIQAFGYEGPIKSPTYGLMHCYSTNPVIVHADLYRLNDIEEIGLEEHLNHDLCIIEWPERAPQLFSYSNVWEFCFETIDIETRKITVKSPREPLIWEPQQSPSLE